MQSNHPKAYSYIRMSTEVQLRGDSKRRQEELSRAYADEHGLELVEGAALHDIGVSAFKGANVRSEGALGRFMAAVKAGEIEEGSYLLVESLDRLSRQEIIKSLALFVDILEGGIKLVTLADNEVYEDGADFQQILFSLVIMSRAYEESKMKSQRVSAAWSAKRDKAGEQIMTRRVPAWLEVNQDKTVIQVNSERAQTVKAIFEYCRDGLGNFAIAKRLNEDGVAPFGSSQRWNPSSINKILSNRAVIGEFQPRVQKDGAWTDAGEALMGYFPVVVDPELFHQVQESRRQRKVSGGGRKGQAVSNLFSGLARCGECRGKMLYLNKGAKAYLTCENARKSGTCSSKSWPYLDFETSFLSFVAEVDLTALEGGEVGPSKTKQQQDKIKALKGQLADLEVNRQKTYDLILETDETDFLASQFQSLEADIERVKADLNNLELGLRKEGKFGPSAETLKQIASVLQDTNTTYEVRAHAASLIKDQVSALLLWRRGSGYVNQDIIKEYGDQLDDGFKTHLETFARSEPHFGVGFKQGSNLMRGVYPDPKNPAIVYDIFVESDLGKQW